MTEPTQAYLIDPPRPFDPLDVWEAHEAEINWLPQDLPELRAAIARIARRKANEPKVQAMMRTKRPG